MKITIEGTKSDIMELLAEIRRRDKEYITVPNPYPIYPTKYHTKSPWYYEVTCTTAKGGDTE